VESGGREGWVREVRDGADEGGEDAGDGFGCVVDGLDLRAEE